MQELALEMRRLEGPRAPWHVGDIAWGLRQHAGREHEWRIRLWEENGRVVGWSWLKGDGGLLELDVHPDHRHLIDELLAEPDARVAFAFEDDDEGRAALARHGFVRPGEVMDYNVRDLGQPPRVPSLPKGFRLRSLEPEDLARRVDLHREVWAPSRVTEESYANVTQTWPYRASLDCVVEAPDGRFAAYALLWPDDENGVGELEPVGTRAEFRRLGLGAAVCAYALRRWHEQGGRQAIVYSATGPARALYRALGFECHSRLLDFARA
jgi:ribosomal protein S18 acetylase RimI-like enzyme